MKGRVLFVLLLHVVLASMLSGCRTADVAGGQAAHRAALQALSSRSCKIILEEVYTPSDRPEKLRAQQVTGSYLIIKGDKMLAYLTREDNSPKLFFGSSPLNDGEAALQMGVPETQKNGDVNITLRVQGNAHYRTFEWNMTGISVSKGVSCLCPKSEQNLSVTEEAKWRQCRVALLTDVYKECRNIVADNFKNLYICCCYKSL